jgi:hypothetical protein
VTPNIGFLSIKGEPGEIAVFEQRSSNTKQPMHEASLVTQQIEGWSPVSRSKSSQRRYRAAVVISRIEWFC